MPLWLIWQILNDIMACFYLFLSHFMALAHQLIGLGYITKKIKMLNN